MAPIPLRTPREDAVAAGNNVDGADTDGNVNIVDQIDAELRKALQAAKMLGEWVPSLFSGGGIVVPGPVQQVTEQYLRSTDCTPAGERERSCDVTCRGWGGRNGIRKYVGVSMLSRLHLHCISHECIYSCFARLRAQILSI